MINYMFRTEFVRNLHVSGFLGREITQDIPQKRKVEDCYIICAMVKSRYIGDGHPTFNRNPYNGYINPYGIGLSSFPSPIIWK